MQARGYPNFRFEPDWLLNHINELTTIHELRRQSPWKVDDAPSDFIEKLVKGIVGIEMPVTKITGKWKLGQNRQAADQEGIVKGLLSTEEAGSVALAKLSKHHFDDT